MESNDWMYPALDVLPERDQEEVIENFLPAVLVERLAKRIRDLEERISELERDIDEYAESQPPI